MRISEHFGLGKHQAQLDFVDVPVDRDIPLYVDPYALSIEPDPWFVEASDLVVHYFSYVLRLIREGNDDRARRVLAHLGEPNETHLGESKAEPAGRGVGPRQALELYDRLAGSEAVRTGQLRDLEDCELVIPGLGRDKLSDMTINIIRSQLIAYTQLQCSLHAMPTQTVPAGFIWDRDICMWRGVYAELPVVNECPLLLVPKLAVRYDLACRHEDYYRHFVLTYLQAEHVNAGSSLVEVLKNGRLRVTKKSLEEEYPLSKEFLYEFSREHPDVLERFKTTRTRWVRPLTDDEMEARNVDPRQFDPESLLFQLEQISPGATDANRYHELVVGIVEYVFYPTLWRPVKERVINEGRKRIDLVCSNAAKGGFFQWLSLQAGVSCPYVSIEAKNYSTDPGNPEVDQLLGRFSPDRGYFGILFCRSISDIQTVLRRCKDAVHARQGYVIVLTDEDVRYLVQARQRGDEEGIWAYLDAKYQELVM